MDNKSSVFGSNVMPLIGGALLILLGILFLIAQLFGVRIGAYLWPFFVIVPGVLIFIAAFAVTEKGGEGLAVFGGITTATGVLLFFQNVTDLWASWAYAWALVAPTSVGLALMAYGAFKGHSGMTQSGMRLTLIGLAIFAVGFVFFELIIGVSGFGLGRWAWPLLLIGLGVLLVLGAFLPALRRSKE